MKWTFTHNSVQHTADWRQGAMRCTLPAVIEVVDEIIADGGLIPCGSAVNLVTPTLNTEQGAYATITLAVQQFADIQSLRLPPTETTVINDIIIDEEFEKGRPRKFATREEAARYAAQIRWGTRGPDGGGSGNGPSQDEIEMGELSAMAEALQYDLMLVTDWDIDGRTAAATNQLDSDRRPKRVTPTQWDKGEGGLIVDLNGEVVPSKKLAELESRKQELGIKAISIAKRRLAERGITEEGDKARSDAIDKQIDTLTAERKALSSNVDHDTLYDRLPQINEYTSRIEELKRQKQNGSYHQAVKEETRRVVAQARPVGEKPNFKNSFGDKPTAEYEDVVSSTVPSSVVLRVRPVSLAWGTRGSAMGTYQDWNEKVLMSNDFVNMYNVSPDAKRGVNEFRGTALHEYGHVIQHSIPAVMALDAAFLSRRIRGGPRPRALSDLKVEDTGKASFWKQRPTKRKDVGLTTIKDGYEDDFGRPYTGRTYRRERRGQGSHREFFSFTEVLSTGMEEFLGHTPSEREDLDLLAHTVGTLLSV